MRQAAVAYRGALRSTFRLVLLWVLPMLVFAGVFSWRVLFPSTPAAGPAMNPLQNAPDPAFSERIIQALAMRSDPLAEYFRIKPLSLQGHFYNLSDIKIGRKNLAIIDDSPEPGVSLYDLQGNFKTKLGSAGSGPGKYVTPSDVAIGDSVAAISDFTIKRINVFSVNGTLLKSFVYGPQQFSASAVALNQRSGQFLLFGNKWKAKEGGDILFIHEYTGDGRYLRSSFSLPKQGQELGLQVYDQPVIRHVSQSIWFMLPWDYRVFSISSDGSIAVVFHPQPPSSFKPPLSRPPMTSFATFQHWTMSWTPVISFASQGSDLLVETQCFCQARYNVDVWSLPTGHLHRRFSTNWKLLGYDDPYFYFARDDLHGDGKHSYEFKKAILDIK